MKPFSIQALRIITLTEATSFLILLAVAMPLKYFAGIPEAVKWVGWIHGILFVMFCVVLVGVWLKTKMNLDRVLLVFVASLVPIVPFFLDWKNESRGTVPE